MRYFSDFIVIVVTAAGVLMLLMIMQTALGDSETNVMCFELFDTIYGIGNMDRCTLTPTQENE